MGAEYLRLEAQLSAAKVRADVAKAFARRQPNDPAAQERSRLANEEVTRLRRELDVLKDKR